MNSYGLDTAVCRYSRKYMFLLPASLLLNKKLLHKIFSCEFCEVPKNIFPAEHLQMFASATS